jgi:rare lipoprotein A (peptidoglycan hydrolase)
MLVLSITFVLVFGLVACGGGSVEQAQEEQAQERTPQEEQTEGEGKEMLREKQRAAYYGEEFADSPTASGELYDPSGFTAAHKELPFGTVLDVCYHDCTQVTVNDRNPDSAADLDLSLAAADYIGLTPDGHGVVDAEVVKEEHPTRA